MDETGVSASELGLVEIQNELESDLSQKTAEREQAIESLEEEYPSNTKLITASDLLSLHAISETLAAIPNLGDKDQDTQALQHSLEFEQKQLIDKTLRVVAAMALADALNFRTNRKKETPPLVTQLASRVVEEHKNNNSEEDRLTTYTQGEFAPIRVIYALARELHNQIYEPDELYKDKVTKSDVVVALEYVAEISEWENWRSVGKKSLDIINNPHPTTAQVQALISSLHQGGEGDAAKVEEAGRPILEHISEKPWEAANVLTAVFAGRPRATSAILPSSIIKLMTPFRGSPNVQNYLSPVPMNEQTAHSLYKWTDKPFFKTALSFNQALPTELIIKENPSVDFKRDSDSIMKFHHNNDLWI